MKFFTPPLVILLLIVFPCCYSQGEDWYYDGESLLLPPASNLADYFIDVDLDGQDLVLIRDTEFPKRSELVHIAESNAKYISLTLILGADSFQKIDTIFFICVGKEIERECNLKQVHDAKSLSEVQLREFATHLPGLYSLLKERNDNYLPSYHMNILEYEVPGVKVQDTLYGRSPVLEMFTRSFCVLPKVH